MATAQTESRSKSPARKATPRKSAGPDAVALLKADHREVEGWFDDFEKAKSDSKKQKLADQICMALKIHTEIEAEIFYPACRDAGVGEDMMDEADVEHDAAKKLIAEIEDGGAGDDHWDAKVTVLGEMVKHHIGEEEQRDGMFAKAKKADLNLNELGEELSERKKELMKEKKNGRN